MARPWVKLSTEMSRHPDIMGLSGDAFKLWVVCLIEAGRANDHGRVGKVKHLSWVLRQTPEQVRTCLEEVNGQLIVEDDEVTVRDWYQWQPHRIDNRPRSDKRNGVGPCGTARGTVGDVDVDVELEVLEGGSYLKDNQLPSAHSVRRWDGVEQIYCSLFGEGSARTKAGKTTAALGKFLRVVGSAARDDPVKGEIMAKGWADEERRDPEWPRWVTAKNAHERFAKVRAGVTTFDQGGGA